MAPRSHLPWLWLALFLGLLHFATELACSQTLTFLLGQDVLPASRLLLYNGLAFCLQPFVGWLVDRRRCARTAVGLGALLVILGCLAAPQAPGFAIALLGLGNACLHVGAGSLSLSLAEGRTAALGLLVGPGAFGLVLGKQLAASQSSAAISVSCLFATLLAFSLLRLPAPGAVPPAGNNVSSFKLHLPTPGLAAACGAALVLPCIAIRSLVGGALVFSWTEFPSLALAAGLALALGKIAGGFLADRFGWLCTCIAALLLAVPLLALGESSVVCGLAGTALFQVPMAVTLALLAQRFPDRPAFSFGLASAAIFLGACINSFDTNSLLSGTPALALLSLVATTLLWLALRRSQGPASA